MWIAIEEKWTQVEGKETISGGNLHTVLDDTVIHTFNYVHDYENFLKDSADLCIIFAGYCDKPDILER